MLDFIKQYLSSPNHPLIDAFILLTIAIFTALIVSYFIKWTFLAWSNKKQRTNLAFVFNAIRLPITISIVLIGINNAVHSFELSDKFESLLPMILQSIDIIVWGQFIYRSSQFSLKNLSQTHRQGGFIQPQTLPLFENIAAVLVVLIIFYLLFITWNIDMSAWLASAGIIGIAVGFAAKDTIANLLSGVFILADSPYKIGDYIVIDSGERGMVTHIGLRSTRILTRDDLEINVPNAIIANGKIVNESSGRHIKSRTRVAVSVAYDVDIDHVKSTLMHIASEETQICTDPEPRVRFRQFGASGLDMELLVWIDNPEIRGRVVDSLNTAIYKRFAIEGIEIPFSKHDLYIKSLPPQTEN
ncbi:mechanosensitive ion channel family protein [Thiomicrorhabdus sp.]|uniref:mechanosensitive ion channel family protein n=1 Tax=Thiomicrorhabdus sp. TaxID=2039724 RepID=UPI002AA81D40|nr:mechanosensitive ion channel domain-containing protein [Thiomicrorhabdus sp.]